MLINAASCRPEYIIKVLNHANRKGSEVVDKSSNIGSLCQSPNSFYTDVIRNAQTAQNKFPLNSRENERSRDSLLCYLALREHDLSDFAARVS